MGYLKTFPKGKILFNTSYPDHSKHMLEKMDWSKLSPDAEEEILRDMLEPKGKPVMITVYVDADHTHDQVTRRSNTEIIVF